jgi:sterol desaturase/sphingolipid hydroxylase (fatty acid hydroxylase superfamily)
MSLALAVLAGALLWTLAEYLLHRFVFHEMPGEALGAREHRMHHADPSWFAPWTQKAAAALAVTALILPLAWLAAGPAVAVALTAGFTGMYLAYEVLHRRVHTHPPRGPYGRWRRRHHFAHHFTDPRRAHGVTSPLWDHVFGTTLPAARVRVPRRLAMAWLVDAEGRVRPELADDYELVGRGARRPAA